MAALFDDPTLATTNDAEYFHPGAGAPLAVRMRPRSLDEVVGQHHLLGPGAPLRRLVEGNGDSSVILYGPPGTGKTTLASLISVATGRIFRVLSALNAGVKDIREVVKDARRALTDGKRTVLFIDEVHRFSKTQQDALLAAVENRTVLLVAATTENPSFSVVGPLLSRSLLLQLKPLEPEDIRQLLHRAVADERGLGGAVRLGKDAEDAIVALAGGDARRALTYLEAAAESVRSMADTVQAEGAGAPSTAGTAEEPAAGENTAAGNQGAEAAKPAEGKNTAAGNQGAEAAKPADGENIAAAKQGAEGERPRAAVPTMTAEDVQRNVDRALVQYDRDGDQHYDVISAFIKSIRGSDVDAALHYLARMLVAGEDPRFIARRLVIHASEDIGMADPTALLTATAALHAVQFVGLPEARLALAQATIHLATAPKSGAVIAAIDAAMADVRAGKIGSVPAHLRDGHYAGAEALGHAVGYIYPHNDPRGIVRQQYAPEPVVGAEYYQPTDHGAERGMAQRLDAMDRIVKDHPRRSSRQR